ncbi:MAG: hypothetical protein ACREBB_08600 [Nitrosotalea sp.]
MTNDGNSTIAVIDDKTNTVIGSKIRSRWYAYTTSDPIIYE